MKPIEVRVSLEVSIIKDKSDTDSPFRMNFNQICFP
jgi:hypothetical protein